MSKKAELKKIILNLTGGASAAVVVLGLIIFLSMIIGGNNWDVNPYCKLSLAIPNILLFPIALILFSLYVALNFLVTKKKADNTIAETGIDKKKFLIVSISLVLIYALWYFVNIKISKKTAFFTGWDPSCVQGTAYKLFNGEKIGAESYYSTYPNNVPMAWILYRTFDFIKGVKSYRYYPEFFWIQLLCAMESLTGIFLGIASYVWTKKIMPVVFSAVLFIALAGISPWSLIPYTDTFSILFPIMALCFYFIYLEMKKNARYILLFAAYILLVMGSLIKITVIIVLISIIISELFRILIFNEENRKRIFVVLLPLFLTIPLYFGAKNFMYKDTGAELTENVAVSWQHYFYMGLIEETTGAYNSGAFSLIGKYQFEPKAERNRKELELAGEILKERKFFGSAFFYLKKLVMSYNDGTFTWRGEGGMILGEYPDISSPRFTEELRSFLWNGGEHELAFNTYSQCVWILILLAALANMAAVSYRIFTEKKVDFKSFSAALSIVGITLFIMLFEARARYFYNYIPVFILLASCIVFNACIKKRKKPSKEQSAQSL
ncbi:MAG: hypothetical protein K5776_03245 [Lachnospiraceae bacterium]|nr:hypothetical protein [Lachnospiraceae bacterium]